MKIIFRTFTLFVFLSLLSFAQSRVEEHQFYSPALGINKTYQIYLPAGYDQSSTDYPVVYFFRNREHEWFNTSWRPNGRALKEVADDLIASGMIGPMILVGPNSGSNRNASQYYGVINMLEPLWANAAGIGTGKFEDYLTQDLITHIDSTYKTLNSKDYRGIDGFSMGGYASTTLAFKHPELFCSVGSFDGTLMYYNLDDPGVPGVGEDDGIWITASWAASMFGLPRNIPYMLEHSAVNILESADISTLDQLKANRYHLSTVHNNGAGNHSRNFGLVNKMAEKGIRNSWGDPLIHHNAMHTYEMSDVHATASLIKHWQAFEKAKISTPALIDFGITVTSGENHRVVVFNYGPDPLTINSVYTNTGNFFPIDLPVLPAILQPLTDSLVFHVQFKPSQYQAYTDTLFISSDDPNANISKTILRGTGGSFKCEPGIMYATSNYLLYKIEFDPFSVTEVGQFNSDIGAMSELLVDPNSYELYGIHLGSGYQDVDIINTRGNGTFWYQILTFSSVLRDVFMAQDGYCYLVASDGKIFKTDIHYMYDAPSIDLVTETNLYIHAMAQNPVNGVVWASVNGTVNHDEIYTIDLVSGTANLIGTTGFNKIIEDLTFDGEGNLYGLIGGLSNPDTLVKIDQQTGTATAIGNPGTNLLNAIVISPEPTSSIAQQQNAIPTMFYLAQNYPNPFNPTTSIKYQVPSIERVCLKIFDVLGREVATLVNEIKSPGNYEVEFNAANLPSGVYFYRLRTGDFIETKKMLLLK